MFFNSRKKAKLAEEAQKKEQRRIQAEKEQQIQKLVEALRENTATFYRICDMVCSLPKKRHIVVVQREDVFISDSDRNRAYLLIAKRLHHKHQSTGQKWMSGFGEDNDALYAFYEPTKPSLEFDRALRKFSEGGYRIQRIRYYSRNL